MDNIKKPSPDDFAGYLQSVVQLEALERMTRTLDSELADSQRGMQDIKAIFDSICTGNNINNHHANSHIRYENVKDFLDADLPKLIMPDMEENNYADVDLNAVIGEMKSYVEELKKNLIHINPQPTNFSTQINPLDLDQYASSLDQFKKRLSNMKISKKNKPNRNPDLEIKLTQLCQDVNMFTQMVQAKTTLSEYNKNWTETLPSNNSLHYDNIINQLLSRINEVTYLLQNKNQTTF
ncbi:unnamed protein product [Diatraea saccharalis]|uniref:Uncharacterized protein n=1 Tax=Diatraea saccharalis TaxID=40085 RepID=A0A9N9QU42_9NEOP|nr:unnamed protein product [Diatraea saccharalis]